MTEPEEQTIWYYAGSGRNLTFTRLSGSTNITGWALRFAVKDSAGTQLFTCSTAGGDITIDSGANGIFTVDVATADSLSATAGEYRWDVWRVDAGNEEWLAGGRFVLKARQVALP